jgi:hypothetical protein
MLTGRLLFGLAGLVALLGGLLAPQPAAASGSVIQHVVLIALENHTRSQVIGTRAAPYETTLARNYGQATDYVNVSRPSLPNYMELTGGTAAGITSDCSPGPSCDSRGITLFGQLGPRWRAYDEGMPRPCDHAAWGAYTVRHNPAAYYTHVQTACAHQDVPLPANPSFGAAFTMVTPNLCHDMHDCGVATADEWLKHFIPKVYASPQWKAHNTAIFLWWDENGGAGPLPFVVISPYTHHVVYRSRIDHFSTLRTIELLLGRRCTDNACHRNGFVPGFHL